jgi:hypothetical protein
VTEVGAVAGDERTTVEVDRRDKDRPVLVVDWQGSHTSISIAAMEREDLALRNIRT